MIPRLGGTTRGCQALVEHVSMIDIRTLSIYANSLNSYLFLYANTHSNMQIHGFYQPKVGQTWSGGSYDSLEQVYTIKLKKYYRLKFAILNRADFSKYPNLITGIPRRCSRAVGIQIYAQKCYSLLG